MAPTFPLDNPSELAACIILYYPPYDFISNIKSYEQEVARIILIDNSDSITEAALELSKTHPKVSYYPQFENKGIAKALNLAVEIAKELGHEWILTMDQDSSFLSVDFFKEITELQNNEVGIIAASHSDSFIKKKMAVVPKFFTTPFVITSGNVLSIKAWQKIGGFRENFFIDEVDNEFCMRLTIAGYVILSSKKIYLSHTIGDTVPMQKGLPSRTFSLHSPVRMYYITRNGLKVITSFLFRDPYFALNRIKNLLSIGFRIINYYPNKKQYIKMVYRGIFHFVTSQYGKLR